jgi:leucyl-tRNA synthetase
MDRPYDHRDIEKKWQDRWLESGVFVASDDRAKKKYYALIEFPYPSGVGLHVGHPRPYIGLDLIARKRRREGYNVLYPIGWDAFGLPTENYALKTGRNPREITKENSGTFRRQIQSLGISFDWSREINTTDPGYYKWTQWIFLQLFKHGLAYKAKTAINWCPKDKIGLANEEVVDGACERCGTPVEKREREQWMLGITKYAKRLYDDLDTVDYIERAKTQQRNWIGPSEGAEIDFALSIPDTVKRFVFLHGKGGSPERGYWPWLAQELKARGYEVQMSALPNSDAPDDEEQADAAMKLCTFDETTAVVAQSFGGVVAMRLLERGVTVNRVILAAMPVTGKYLDGKERPTVTEACEKGFDFTKIQKQAKAFIVLADTNDHVIPLSDGEMLAEKLGAIFIKGRGNKGHFSAEVEQDVLMASVPTVRIFTTRPDTLFGATYLVLAPEHPWVTLALDGRHDVIANKAEVKQYVEAARKKADAERTAEGKEKTGVVVKGVMAVNPATKEKIPVWVADYVIGSYGTGAVMAVPAHDERDWEFAKKFKLPIRDVVSGGDSSRAAYTGSGTLVHSEKFDGLSNDESKKTITDAVQGRTITTYRLRDWVFSRQRYWGEPIPMIHCGKCAWQPVPESELPVRLPEVEKYQPTDTGESPLANIHEWVDVKCPNCAGPARRETDVMPNWAGSSWYYLRYTDPTNDSALADKKKLEYWTPVDWYNGGMEHTVLHLLYSRFWHKFLFDIGAVPTPEPYKKRTSHGIILAEGGEKMSKSKGNVVNPDEMVERFGADTLRMYEMFMGPFDQAIAWSTNGLVGMRRFLERVWNLSGNVKDGALDAETEALLNQTIKKVGDDIESMKFNTAVSALMIYANHLGDLEVVPSRAFKSLLSLLAPLAPHIAEELWQESGYSTSVHAEPWPSFDEKKMLSARVTIAVQVGGKTKGTLEAPRSATEAEVETLVRSDQALAKHIPTSPKKVIYVPGRVLNFIP